MRTPLHASLLIAALAIGCAAEPSPAAPPQPPPSRPALPGRIEAALYPAELVIAHQRALALDDAQVAALSGDMQSAQQELTSLAWRVGRAEEDLATRLDASHVDEDAALAAARELAAAESEIKLAHLRLLIRMRNRLTDAQRARLDALR